MRKRIVGLVILLVLAVAAVGLYAVRPTYTATAILYVEAVPPHLVNAETDLAIFQKTQATLMRTLPVLKAAMQRPGISRLPIIAEVAEREDPAQWLARKLEIDSEGEIIRISLRGDDAQTPAALVNAATDAYLEQFVLRQDDARRQRLEMLQSLYDAYQERIQDSRRKLKEATDESQAEELRDEIAERKDAARKIGREIERLRVELQAKPRVQLVQRAEPPSKADTDPWPF